MFHRSIIIMKKFVPHNFIRKIAFQRYSTSDGGIEFNWRLYGIVNFSFAGKRSTFSKSKLQVAIGIMSVSSIALYFAINSDEGTKRSVQFWRRVFPIYLHYRFYQVLDRDLGLLDPNYADRKFDELHDMYTDTVKDIVYTMRGFYLKNCQLMSTQVLF